jgi:hypothetical protein
MGIALAAATASVLTLATGATSTPSLHYSVSYGLLPTSGAAPTFGVTNGTYAVANSSVNMLSGVTTATTDIQEVTIYNNTGTAQIITVKHSDGTTAITKYGPITMGVGYTLSYDENNGWNMFDANMNRLVGYSGSGRLLKVSVIAAGTTTYTFGNGTNSARLVMVGAGGAGGGVPSTSGEHGSGGGAGAYAEWFGSVTPGYTMTVAVGTGGAGSAGANGGNGSASTTATPVSGGSTVTCPAGSGGKVGASTTVPVIGGAGGGVATNGTVNAGGQAGFASLMSATTGVSGAGAPSPLGAGGAQLLFGATTAGNAATGYGAGGGGASAFGTSTAAGGAGANGVIIVEEYS